MIIGTMKIFLHFQVPWTHNHEVLGLIAGLFFSMLYLSGNLFKKRLFTAPFCIMSITIDSLDNCEWFNVVTSILKQVQLLVWIHNCHSFSMSTHSHWCVEIKALSTAAAVCMLQHMAGIRYSVHNSTTLRQIFKY